MTAATLAPSPIRAARSVAANLAGAGFAGLAGVAVTWLVAHSLGPAHAGAFFSATAAFVLAGAVSKLGTQTGLVYWLARYRVQGDAHLLGACLRAALAPVAVTAAAVGVVTFLIAPHLGAPEYAVQLRVLAVFLPFAVLSDCLLAATRGYRQMRPTVLLERVTRPALQLTGIGVLAFLTAAPAVAYTGAWVAPYLPVVAGAGYLLYRAAHGQIGVEARSGRSGVGREFWKFTWPRAIASVAQQALQRVDVLLVAGLAGLGAAAVYAVAGRFVVLGQFANQAITQAVQPRLAERLASGDRAGANALYQTATGWLVLTTWPLYLIAAGNAPVYLGLFGDSYRDGVGVVVVLAGAMLVGTGCGMVDVVLSMAGSTLWNLGNVGLALVAMVGIDLALIPRLGALGAAVGLAAAVVVNNLLPLAQVGFALRLHPFGRGTCLAAALATACFGVLPALFAPGGPAARLAVLAGAGAAYLAGAHRLRRPLALDAFLALRNRRPR